MKFQNLRIHERVRVWHLGGEEWNLLAPYTVSWNGYTKSAPTGFVTDFSSIPRWARSLIPQMGDQNGPSVMHDYCYVTLWRNSRADADTLFLELMKVAGVNFFRRHLMYVAARAGGWLAWNRNKQKRAQK